MTGEGVGAVRVLRILRLLRALRILRAAKVFPQLTLVLETLIRSISSVVYIWLFLLLISYIFAIVAVTVFGEVGCFPALFLRFSIEKCRE